MTIHALSTSDDGELKAVLCHGACGGATGQASQVSVLAASRTELHRSAPRALTLTYYGRSRIIPCEPEVRGVAITHRSTD